MLIAHYPLTEDTGGTAYDYSGNGNDGTVTGATQGSTGGILGSTAYSFDGTDDYVNINRTPTLSGSISISAWINTNSLNNGWFLDNFGISSGDQHYILGFSAGTNDGIPSFFIDDGSTATSANEGSTISTNTWYHIVGVYDSSAQELMLYRDAVVVGTNTHGGSTPNFQERAPVIASRPDNSGNFFDGEINDVRVYNRALTPHEIQYLAQRPFRSRIYTAVKDAGSSVSPDITDAQYTLNGETVKVYVTGSPDSASPETQAVTLDGTTSFTLSWASSHQFFQITAVAESTDPTTASQIDQIDLSA